MKYEFWYVSIESGRYVGSHAFMSCLAGSNA